MAASAPVVVTRPLPEALQWVARLREAGRDAVALPLIDIRPAPDPLPLQDAWRDIATCTAAMFVSGNAVRGFFGARPVGGVFSARAWAPGPGTRDALRAAGVAAGAIDSPAEDAAQFDSESLWEQVEPRLEAGQRVLIVRGGGESGNGRDWLARQLRSRAVRVDTVTAYVRGVPAWTPSEREVAESLLDNASAVWLFSSSEAIANLRTLLPGRSFAPTAALATHPRIAEAARQAGFGRVRATGARLADVMATLESTG